MMKLKIYIIFLLYTILLTGCASSGSRTEIVSVDSFSFTELELAPKVNVPPLQYISADDGVNLAYREYIPAEIEAILVFYHGGGAYSKAGYQHIGDGLSKRFNILVVTPDIRGHGDSDGERGDTPDIEQIFDDVSTLIQFIKARYPQKKLYLGGHSSGGGLVLNYSSYKKKEDTNGYLFLSPQLGFRSNTEFKNNPNPFATIKQDLFVQNTMSGTEGNSYAVFFNYSEELLQTTKNLPAITVNMANAITPESPKKQIRDLDLPAAVWVGEKDELFDAEKVVALFQKNNPGTYTRIIENEKHLSILVNAADVVGLWIRETATK